MSKFILFLIVIRPIMDILVGFTVFRIGEFDLNFGELWGIAFIATSLSYLLGNKINLVETLLHKLLILLLIVSLLSLFFFTDNLFYGLTKYSKWLTWVLGFFVLFDAFKNSKNFYSFDKKINLMAYFVISAYLLGIFLQVILKINLTSFLGYDVYGYSSVEAGLGFTSFFYSTHTISFLSLFLIVLVFLRNSDKQRFEKKDLFIFIGLVFVNISVLARTGILALIVFLLLIVKNNKRQFILLFLLFISLSILFISKDIIENRFLYDFNRYETGSITLEGLGSGRIGMWMAVIKYYMNQDLVHQLFGSGFDADLRATALFWVRRGAHNDFLDLMLGAGIISLFTYSFLLIRINKIFKFNRHKHSLRIKRTTDLFHAFFWSSIILMFFQGLTMTTLMFYYILIVIYSYWKIKRIPISSSFKVHGTKKEYLLQK